MHGLAQAGAARAAQEAAELQAVKSQRSAGPKNAAQEALATALVPAERASSRDRRQPSKIRKSLSQRPVSGSLRDITQEIAVSSFCQQLGQR